MATYQSEAAIIVDRPPARARRDVCISARYSNVGCLGRGTRALFARGHATRWRDVTTERGCGAHPQLQQLQETQERPASPYTQTVRSESLNVTPPTTLPVGSRGLGESSDGTRHSTTGVASH